VGPHRHLLAAVSFGVISMNLLFWCVPLALLAPVRIMVPGARWPRRALAWIYRAAVRVDDVWLRGVLGVRWPRPEHGLGREETAIVLSNHRSWADIFVVQSVIARDGPVVKFLAKRELLWIPVLGLIFRAFDFPVLRRRARGGMAEAERRAQDAARLAAACAILDEAPGAMLVFAEGTRFTPAKHAAATANPRYQHLLSPRPGGFAALAQALPRAPVIDLTLAYAGGDAGFWRFLGGALAPPDVRLERPPRPDADHAAAWLNERWALKDARLRATDWEHARSPAVSKPRGA
jgi:1-acyl-sn-glycerol-3-phosphate acyltransferase